MEYVEKLDTYDEDLEGQLKIRLSWVRGIHEVKKNKQDLASPYSCAKCQLIY